jgi:hypothetical protein
MGHLYFRLPEMFLYCLAEAIAVRRMDWKKILEASKVSIAAVILLAIVQEIVGAMWSSQPNGVKMIFAIISLAIPVYAGYSGVSSKKFTYRDAGTSGAIIGIVTGIAGFIVALIGVFGVRWDPFILALLVASSVSVAIYNTFGEIIFFTLLSLAGAFIAKKSKR